MSMVKLFRAISDVETVGIDGVCPRALKPDLNGTAEMLRLIMNNPPPQVIIPYCLRVVRLAPLFQDVTREDSNKPLCIVCQMLSWRTKNWPHSINI